MVGFFLPLSHWYLDETVLTWPQGMTKEGLRVVATRRLSFISPLTYSEVVFKLTCDSCPELARHLDGLLVLDVSDQHFVLATNADAL